MTAAIDYESDRWDDERAWCVYCSRPLLWTTGGPYCSRHGLATVGRDSA